MTSDYLAQTEPPSSAILQHLLWNCFACAVGKLAKAVLDKITVLQNQGSCESTQNEYFLSQSNMQQPCMSLCFPPSLQCCQGIFVHFRSIRNSGASDSTRIYLSVSLQGTWRVIAGKEKRHSTRLLCKRELTRSRVIPQWHRAYNASSRVLSVSKR